MKARDRTYLLPGLREALKRLDTLAGIVNDNSLAVCVSAVRNNIEAIRYENQLRRAAARKGR